MSTPGFTGVSRRVFSGNTSPGKPWPDLSVNRGGAGWPAHPPGPLEFNCRPANAR